MKDQYSNIPALRESTNQPFILQDWLAETVNLTPDSSLRILVILSQQPTQTGSGVYVRELVEELQTLGHIPYLLAAHYKPLTSADFLFLSDNHIYTMIFNNGENTDSADIGFPIPGMSLDMPYLHLPFRDLSDSMLEEYRRVWIAKLRIIVNHIRPHIIHVNHLWFLAAIVREAIPWLPVVSTTHGSEFILLQDAPRFSASIKPGIQGLDTIMAISTNTARDTIEMLGVSPDRIHIIGNGYNPRLFHIMERKQGEPILGRLLSRYHALPPWNKLVLYVGKFAAYKGLPYFIRAAAAYTNGETSNVLTLIVGEGSKTVRDRLESLVETAGLQKRILLPGKLAYEEVGPLMNMADVFILPSYTEGFGLVLLEALACGLRSVAADKGGPPFFVPDILREKGFVTLVKAPEFLEDHQLDPSDEERYVRDLGAAIVQHLASPPSQSERRTIADSVKNLTWTSRVKETISVYLSAIENRRNSYLEKT